MTFIDQLMKGDTNAVITVVAVCFILFIVYSMFSKSANKGGKAALEPTSYRPFVLSEKTQLTHDVWKFQFLFPEGKTSLGMGTGQHLFLKFQEADGKDCSRQYTPISRSNASSNMELVVKIYPNSERKAQDGTVTKYPPGRMGTHLKNMKIGDSILVRGPSGKLIYEKNGLFRIKDDTTKQFVNKQYKHVGMISGGTGITPCLSIIREIMLNKDDTTQVSLILANQTETDILCREELETYAKYNKNFHLHYTLDRPDDKWTYSKGFVNQEMIEAHLPKANNDTLVLMCGPPIMMKFIMPHLDAAGYSKSSYHTF